MHYLIFIPGQQGQNPAHLVNVGLADFVGSAEFRNSDGPSEEPGKAARGVLIGWRKPGSNQPLHYNAGEQTWFPAVPASEGLEARRYWVGLWNHSPITPEDLQRSHADYGAAVVLGDGNQWVIPAVQSFTKNLILNDDGSWTFEIQRQHQDTWFKSKVWLERLRQSQEVDFGELADFLTGVLRLNYRLCPEVVSHLRLFDTRNVVHSLGAVLGTL